MSHRMVVSDIASGTASSLNADWGSTISRNEQGNGNGERRK